ncbi:2Fe-2S iron-sulfur cluster-binding protein [Actinoplanes sp. NPDC051851]|uniref:2Fe-2S iron-sulfur cluster-binding protein n=1 Tax=Actinoplanes sp. NPDC051851 TaxID=3154753 RepID=UPI003440901A
MDVKQRIGTVGELEAVLGTPPEAVMRKQVDALDDGCRRLLRASPVAGFGYRDVDGVPRTVLVGAVRVVSARRIVVPLPEGDPEPGEGGGVSFVFLLPGIGEVLRLNGTAVRAEAGSVTVAVEQIYVHCARAVLRSGLWEPPRPVAISAAGHGRAPGAGPLADPKVAAILAASPFMLVSTWGGAREETQGGARGETRGGARGEERGGDGGGDTSPRGDHPGFARVLDGDTLAIPDRRGNKRADTFRNLLVDDRFSAAVLVPGRLDVLHLSGRAVITRDPELLATMMTGNEQPHAGLLVTVTAAAVRSGAAIEAARLWDRERHLDPDAVPNMMGLAAQHLATNMAGGVQGLLIRWLTRPLQSFPVLTRRLFAMLNRRSMASEGYAGRAGNDQRAGRAVRVAEVIAETAEATSVVLEDEAGEPFDFRPGQFFTLAVEIDGRTVRRPYSASSAPGSSRLTLTVKRVEGGLVSTYINKRMRKGDRIRLLGPSGSFHAAEPSRRLILIAAGSGVTPMMSIIRASVETTRITLLYGNRSEEDIIFAAELAALEKEHEGRFAVRHLLSRADRSWTGLRGRIDAPALRRELTDDDGEFLVCGPAGMLTAVREVLDELGVPEERRHEEVFTPAVSGATGGTAQRMTVEPYGTIQVEAGQTLLDAGLGAGLPMPYSCTVGSCGECRMTLLRGEVTMAEPNCLRPDERDKGDILTCVARPLSEVAMEADYGGSRTWPNRT